jgi:hypothetical protein
MGGFKQVFELQDKHTKGDQLSDFIAVQISCVRPFPETGSPERVSAKRLWGVV